MGEFKNDGLLHLQFWEDEYNHNISDFAVPEADAKKLYYGLRDYFKQRVETAIHKKEELSKAYIKPTILDRNKNLNDNNWELGLDYLDFTCYEVQCAFESGWDASKEVVIDKACEWIRHYQEYPNHDISAEALIIGFRKYMES